MSNSTQTLNPNQNQTQNKNQTQQTSANQFGNTNQNASSRNENSDSKIGNNTRKDEPTAAKSGMKGEGESCSSDTKSGSCN